MNLYEDIYVPQELNQYFDHAGEANRYYTYVDNYNHNFIATYNTEDKKGNNISLLLGNEYQNLRTNTLRIIQLMHRDLSTKKTKMLT